MALAPITNPTPYSQITLIGPSGSFVFPVNPPSWQVTSGRNARTVEIMNFRQLSRMGNRHVREVSFETFLPCEYSSSYCNYTPVPDPWPTWELIDSWLEPFEPVFLSISGTTIAMYVIITSWTGMERAGEPGDVYVSFAATEFIDTLNSTLFDTRRPASPSGDAANMAGSAYTVQAGDSLWSIAKLAYGSGTLWTRLWEANQNVLRSGNPNLIFAGERIFIPN